MEIHVPCAWTLVLRYIQRLSRNMQRVESGTSLAKMRRCRRHIFVVNSDDKEGLHWFVCAFNWWVRLELFTIWVWKPLRFNHLFRCFLLAIKKLSPTTKHRALGFQTDASSCVPMGARFVDYVLNIINANRTVRVVQAAGHDVEGVTELPGTPE